MGANLDIISETAQVLPAFFLFSASFVSCWASVMSTAVFFLSHFGWGALFICKDRPQICKMYAGKTLRTKIIFLFEKKVVLLQPFCGSPDKESPNMIGSPI